MSANITLRGSVEERIHVLTVTRLLLNVSLVSSHADAVARQHGPLAIPCAEVGRIPVYPGVIYTRTHGLLNASHERVGGRRREVGKRAHDLWTGAVEHL